MASREETIITIDGKELALEASIGTMIVYSDEFRGKLDKPYKGTIEDDILAMHVGTQRRVEIEVAANDEGGALVDENGKYLEPVDGEPTCKVEVDNEDYRGYDLEAVARVMWAMSRAADHGTKMRWPAFQKWFHHAQIPWMDVRPLFETIVYLVGGPFFRHDGGRFSIGAPDEKLEGEAVEG